MVDRFEPNTYTKKIMEMEKDSLYGLNKVVSYS